MFLNQIYVVNNQIVVIESFILMIFFPMTLSQLLALKQWGVLEGEC